MVNISLGHGRENIVAVVDISEGGASVAITACPHEGPSTVLASGRFPISFEPRSKDQSVGTIGQQIKEAAGAALKIYAEAGHRTPVKSVYAIVHAPWTHTVSVQTSSHTPEAVKIQDSTIAALAKEAFAQAKGIEASRLLEACVSRIQLNGYTTREPAGKYAHRAEVTSLISDCDAGVKAAVRSAIESQFPAAAITWRSSIRALIELIRAQRAEHRLIIDMGSDTSHIVSMRDGVLDERIVPEGVRTILARVAAGGMPDETLGHLRMLTRDACSNEACEKVETSLASAEPELARVFGEAIGQLASARHVANDLLLVTHADLEPWLTRFFSRIDFSQFTVTTLPFSVHSPSSSLAEFVDVGISDTALLVGAALVNIESHQ
jgi:hypothetical protein